jgi:methylated-DNA-[protein]-cysteine S-methyltransferase
MEALSRSFYRSPIGDIEIAATESEVVLVEFAKGGKPYRAPGSSPALDAAMTQLDEYFQGRRRVFDLMLRLEGTEFQKRVWRALLDVGYGETANYGEIARAIGRPNAVRAVGAANGRNPVSIIVPCHRIVGSSGDLTGYGGGLWRKKWLLEHEGKNSAGL